MPPLSLSQSTGLTITNPLVLYRALLAGKQIEADPAQHRLALHLQKLYFQLKDYAPRTEYGTQLKQLTSAIDETQEDEPITVAAKGHPLRNNPLFSHLFRRKQKRSELALTQVLTSHDAAIRLDSPRGLLLHGEVGTGKSMLVDLLADSLPNSKKKRWHFNTFMLETIARLESLRISRSNGSNSDTEHSLLWLARDLIERSPILFLDEFQLPDRAASKILSNLLTSFFQLGGVLIATSNRIPDELSKASGIHFVPPPRGSRVGRLFGLGQGKSGGNMFAGDDEFSGFLEVLKARCEVWNMEGDRDWRRRDIEVRSNEVDENTSEDSTFNTGIPLSSNGALSLSAEEDLKTTDPGIAQEIAEKKLAPRYFVLNHSNSEEEWTTTLQTVLKHNPNDFPWQDTTLIVYGRRLQVPRYSQGITYWTFDELCCKTFGPADYITLASTYHTLILDEVPILSLTQKNEARRLITLLDALYEARCKLVIRAKAGPDDLFFPSKATQRSDGEESTNSIDETDGADATYPETFAEIYQDQTSPFRPNISSYKDDTTKSYDPDENSVFGPLPGSGHEIGRHIDFGMTSAFTGEDERFAFKRARSRLWEMCGHRWHTRTGQDWWQPLPIEVRRWEKDQLTPVKTPAVATRSSDVGMGSSEQLDGHAGLKGKYQSLMDDHSESKDRRFASARKSPPKFSETHAWGVGLWGPKAGAWGRSTNALVKNKPQKRDK